MDGCGFVANVGGGCVATAGVWTRDAAGCDVTVLNDRIIDAVDETGCLNMLSEAAWFADETILGTTATGVSINKDFKLSLNDITIPFFKCNIYVLVIRNKVSQGRGIASTCYY